MTASATAISTDIIQLQSYFIIIVSRSGEKLNSPMVKTVHGEMIDAHRLLFSQGIIAGDQT